MRIKIESLPTPDGPESTTSNGGAEWPSSSGLRFLSCITLSYVRAIIQAASYRPQGICHRAHCECLPGHTNCGMRYEMYFDALTLAAVADELEDTILGGRIQRVLLTT